MTLAVLSSQAVQAYDHAYIQGQWQRVDDASPIVIYDSFTEEPVAQVHLAGVNLVNQAVDAAAAALPGWSAVALAERAAYVRRIGQSLLARQDALARSISQEVGMPLKLSARVQVKAPADAWLQYADAAERFAFEEQIRHSTVYQVPVGVIACITPWNYPLHQITAKVAPALLAGCTVVLKPSELAPASAHALAQAIDEAGLPAGVFNVLFGDGPGAGAALVQHPRVQMVSFTGSTAVGQIVARQASASIKRLTLELGGKSASVVLPGANLAQAIRGTIGSCMLNSGQTCNALTRLVVPRADLEQARQLLAEAVAGFAMGSPLEKETRLGPLATAQQAQRVQAMVDEAVAAGAQVVAGGAAAARPQQGYFVAPTVLQVSAQSKIAQEEVFGPVLCLIAYDTAEEALAIANGTPFGLAGAVWAADDAAALAVARRMRCGQVDVNGAYFNLAAPFGGFGMSGVGRENGAYGIAEFLEPVSIQMPA
jgi:acyl-CoA reductase-like NAD-dependent aldehyde dehydrogenase